jgi:hypothetical protein
MARIRCIKPEFPHSESMGRVSRDARLAFILLWTIADDAGRLRGNSRMLASLLYPYDSDAPRLIDRWLGELEAEGCVNRYTIDGNQYLEVRNWLSHQRIDRPTPSKIPSLAKAREDSRGLVEGSPLDRNGMEGIKEGNGKDICGETAEPSSPPDEPAHEPAVLEFPCDGEPSTWRLMASQVAEWQTLFQSLDIVSECRSALAWVLADSARRKTARGMQKFLVGWFGRAQNSGRGRSKQPQTLLALPKLGGRS